MSSSKFEDINASNHFKLPKISFNLYLIRSIRNNLSSDTKAILCKKEWFHTKEECGML